MTTKNMDLEKFNERNDILKMILLLNKMIETSNNYKEDVIMNKVYQNSLTISSLLKERFVQVMDEDGYNASEIIDIDESEDVGLDESEDVVVQGPLPY